MPLSYGVSAPQRHAAVALRVMRLGGLLLFALWVGRYMREPEPLLHGSLLIFHEAGHVLFMPFGEFMMVLGGSVFQLMVPAFFVAWFARRGDVYAACFSGLYLAASFSGVAEYIADARAGELPLLGGDRANHDWTFLLIELKRLEHDVAMGRFVDRVAVLVFLVSLTLGCHAAWNGSAPARFDEKARLPTPPPSTPSTSTPPRPTLPTPAAPARAADALRGPAGRRSPES